jgi:4-alpha-glucanotransferase
VFDAIRQQLGAVSIIAEDLGVITPDVEALRVSCGFPGMRILQFAFGDGPQNPYLPHHHRIDSVVYTGTHDNDTTEGWWASLDERERDRVRRYFATDGRDLTWTLMRAAAMSVAELCVFPMQDVLQLGSDARMNIPGVADANWTWRLDWRQVRTWHADRLADMTELCDRIPRKPALSAVASPP